MIAHALVWGEFVKARVACIACSEPVVALLRHAGFELAQLPEEAAVVVVDVSAGLESALSIGPRPHLVRIGINCPRDDDAASRLAEAGFDELVFSGTGADEVCARAHLALKRAARRSEPARERWQPAILDALPDGVVVVDRGGLVQALNPAAERLFAVRAAEVVGRHIAALIPPGSPYRDFAAFSSLCTLDLRGVPEARLEFTGKGPDDATFGLDVTVANLQLDGEHRYAALVRDVTAQREAERMLRRSEQRYRQAVESLQDVYYRLDEVGLIVDASPSCEWQSGYTRDELVGKPVTSLCVNDADYIQAVRAVLSGERVNDFEVTIRRKDGAEVPVSMNASAILDANGRRIGVQGTLRDISERKRTEREREDLMTVLEANAMVLAQQAAELDSLRSEAEYQASHDTLTGVLNRRAWFASAVHERHTALAIADIDFFKRINDTYGHPAGDAVLAAVAGRLSDVFGNSPLGRVGGEEFGVLFDMPIADCRALCEEALAAFEEPIVLSSGESLMVTLSAGLSPWLPGKHSREESLARTYDAADHLLYQAKQQGRARLVWARPLAA